MLLPQKSLPNETDKIILNKIDYLSRSQIRVSGKWLVNSKWFQQKKMND